MPIYEYVAQVFRPRADSNQDLLLFTVPAGDLRLWAGVPRKAFDYQHGFQRTLDERRVNEAAAFFRKDPKNVSPTAIVVGLRPSVDITPIDIGSVQTASLSGNLRLAKVRIDAPGLSSLSLDDLIDRAIKEVRNRLPTDVTDQIDEDLLAAVNAMAGPEELSESEQIDDGGDRSSDPRSYLTDFYVMLNGYTEGMVPISDPSALRDTLAAILNPGLIVDGQHRVYGAANTDEGMQLAVCAIPNASWEESVYQFVVINQKAKPIKPAFLSSIIATSLSTDEISSIYQRLRASRIDVTRAEEMERLNTDPASPFQSMIDFEVENAPGFLQFPGMNRLLQAYKKIPATHPNLLPEGRWEAVSGEWFDHFCAFWLGIREYFEAEDPRLWREPSEGNPNSLLKIVTLQEVQDLMLDSWADARAFVFSDADETREKANKFWEGFPASFFTDEWRQKGLQTSVGRKIVRDAIMETRRKHGQRNWGHRKLKLFLD